MKSCVKLFLVVLGGRCNGCHIEQHDVRWVVGETIEATLPTLRREWIGFRRGLHIDSYRCIEYVEGHRINVVEQPEDKSIPNRPRLWFVNMGAYEPTSMAELHAFDVIVARSPASAKAKARQRLLKGKEQVHKDDLHGVQKNENLDDLLPIQGNDKWHLELIPDDTSKTSSVPDWYGYWKI